MEQSKELELAMLGQKKMLEEAKISLWCERLKTKKLSEQHRKDLEQERLQNDDSTWDN